MTLCPSELNDVSPAESVVIYRRYAAIKETYLNTEVQKPSLEEILEFQGPRMDFIEESTPHPEARAYLSAYEGGEVLQDFEIEDKGDEKYSSSTNPWPRDMEAEARETSAVIQKRKPTYKRQGLGNRWDQYGESSPATSSEAHVMSEKANVESDWGPWPPSESGNKTQPAQPYRLQKANKSDGQWSKWASDIRQSQPDQWNSHSSRWHSFAGHERTWKYKSYESDWDGSKWSAPTSKHLGSPDYDTDKEWQLRSMRYGDGWAHDPTHSHYKRAKPTQTDPETRMQTRPYRWGLRLRLTT